ncbi:MAG TPA: LLM class flavin-dependent oxidoreductase [Acidimicrobiales bacterium]|nr:LLM class flavin-dependent oxidoreductase [Acidimicrobiales bacterium]
MVRTGVFLPQLRMDFATIEDRVRTAEALGFDSAWFMDHLAPPMARQHDCFEAWTLVAALAARTTQIRLGHLVLCGPFRHPVVLAKMAATVDVISGGRLELGIGWGSLPAELHDYGFGDQPAPVRAAQLAETLEILELLFSGEAVDFTGDQYRLEGAVCRPRPVRGRLPVHLGGAGRTLTMPLVRRFADWWNCPSYAVAELDDLRPLAGERVKVSVQHPIGLAPSAAARDVVVAQAEKRFGSWGGLIAGTPDEVAAALSAEASRGVELFIVQFSDFGQPETLELFAREVMPALA